MSRKIKRISIITVSSVIVLIVAVILTACIGMGPFGQTQGIAEEEGIEIFTLEIGDILQVIAVTGSVDSSTQNKYTMPVSGETISALEKGDTFKKGEVFATVESVKAVSECYMPVGGGIVSVNNNLEESPELVNKSPYGEGWFVVINPSDPSEMDTLMTNEACLEKLKGTE